MEARVLGSWGLCDVSALSVKAHYHGDGEKDVARQPRGVMGLGTSSEGFLRGVNRILRPRG